MGVTLEWLTASSTSIDILSASEEASDGQRAIDDGGTPQTIALELGNGGGGACISGTPQEILQFLTRAMSEVTAHWIEHPGGEDVLKVGDIVTWEHEDGRTERSTIIGVSVDEGMVEVDWQSPTEPGEGIKLTMGEVEKVEPQPERTLPPEADGPYRNWYVCGIWVVFRGERQRRASLVTLRQEEIDDKYLVEKDRFAVVVTARLQSEAHRLVEFSGEDYKPAALVR